jgi:predicted GIY-YIG superfamily endonuclease
VVEAIAREKRINKWPRDRNLKLIEETNPDWRALAERRYPVADPNRVPPVEED